MELNKTYPYRAEQQKRTMLQALEKSLGIVTVACKQAGIGRTTFYEWYDSDPIFRKKVEALKEVALDFAESKLHSRINQGSDSAIIFYLKCQGKSRGYIERQEIESTTKIITVNIPSEE